MAQTACNSQTKNCENDLTGFSGKLKEQPSTAHSRDLETRIAELEQQVVALTERVDRLDGVIPVQYFMRSDATEAKKPGPDKSIEDDELFRSRDGLVGWLEGVWSEIAQLLFATQDPRRVVAILKSVARPKDAQPLWQSRFLQHPARLLDFLDSEKFRKKPPRKTVLDALGVVLEDERRKRAANRLPTRQIANAMAGVPKLSWRTSLDRCSKNPCRYLVTESTAQHYRAMYGIAEPQQKATVSFVGSGIEASSSGERQSR
jgi:hypothetical protein